MYGLETHTAMPIAFHITSLISVNYEVEWYHPVCYYVCMYVRVYECICAGMDYSMREFLRLPGTYSF